MNDVLPRVRLGTTPVLTPRRRVFVGRAIRYGLAGLFATVVYAGAVMGFVGGLDLPPVQAAALATVVVIFTSYVVNRKWVFDTDRSHLSSFSRFVAASGLSIALNAGLMHVAVGLLHWSYLAGVVLATAIVPPVNFAVNHFWAFRPARDADEAAGAEQRRSGKPGDQSGSESHGHGHG